MELIPGRLRQLRLSRLLTQVELAKLTGTTQSTINRIELGLQRPRISTVRRLAAALEVPASALVGAPEGSQAPEDKGGANRTHWSSSCK